MPVQRQRRRAEGDGGDAEKRPPEARPISAGRSVHPVSSSRRMFCVRVSEISMTPSVPIPIAVAPHAVTVSPRKISPKMAAWITSVLE